MKTRFILILITPPFLTLLTRILLPIHYSISLDSLSVIGLLHVFYLIFLGLILLNFLRRSWIYSRKRDEELINISRVQRNVFLGLIVMVLVSPKPVLFGGSDVLPSMILERPYFIWVVDGVNRILFCYGIMVTVFSSSKRKSVVFILMLILALLTGKKASLIMLVSWYFFVMFLSGRQERANFSRIIGLLSLGLMFIVLQYTRSMNIPLKDIWNVSLSLGAIVYYNMNSYLLEYELLSGWAYNEDYQTLIGSLGQMTYFLNPFIKMLGLPGGVSLSLGPFLAHQRGSGILNGVNPTLYYEFWMVYSWFGLFLVPLILVVIAKYLINILKRLKEGKLTRIKAQALFELQFLFFFIQDSLNAIRLLPFLLLIYSFRLLK